ncbi:MAG: hypothetical protein HC932_01555 [Thermales bacterium]|nr:hypothetical protein [Thermales bacterium]
MTDRIQPSEKSILNRRLALNGGISLVDISSNSKEKAIKAASKVYQESLKTIRSGDYPKWVNKPANEINKFRANSLIYTQKLFSHLISLTKPIEEVTKEEEKKSLTEKIAKRLPGRIQSEEQGEAKLKEALSRKELAKKDIKDLQKEEQEIIDDLDKEQQAEEATLGLASNLKTQQLKEEMGLFEKRETKLLIKLQDSGMADYDIWLDLGDLYAKYGEDKKAKEIYALVLKHAQEEQLKEKATNKLIGL